MRKLAHVRHFFAGVVRLLLVCAPLALAACEREESATRLATPRDPAGAVSNFSLADRQDATKYARLTEITRDNVRNLEVAWIYHTGDIYHGSDALAAFEDEPVLVDGNLIICTITRQIIALDPATGAERWKHNPGGDPTKMRKCRGVVPWTDARAADNAACKTRLLWATADRRLLAIDVKDGRPCEDFGQHGVVHIDASKPELFPGEVALSSRPAVVNGVVVVGSAVADNQRQEAPSGRVLAFDARTGAPRWTFDPVPRNHADPAYKTWAEGTDHIGSGNVWSTMSVDEARDLVYVPTSSPSGDFYGAARAGDNRYADSVVALRGSTGQVVWSFQMTHHNVWDYDTPTAPLLIDYPVNGQNVPALIQLTKTGFAFVLNRLTGEPLARVEERPVPQTGAPPGEHLSPTQPFPADMPALAPQGFDENDAWGFTPIDRDSCRKRVEALDHGPLYTPVSTRGTILRPGSAGGANWGGGAYDPNSHIMVVPTARVPMVVTLVPRAQAHIDQGSIETRGVMSFPVTGSPYVTQIAPLMSSFGAPCSAPPWAALTAVDVVNKRILWEVPLGTIDRLMPVPLPLAMGTPGAGGPLVTSTGIVFIGYTLDHRIRAFDLASGHELWKSPLLPAPATATPVTYQAQGAQYVVVTAGGHSMYTPARSDAVVAYRLKR